VAGRGGVIERLAALVGDDVLRITDAASGWPAHAELMVDGVAVPVALFAAPIGLSHRNRDELERRFQNPGGGRPIVDSRPQRDPMLLGLWETDSLVPVERPLVVSADPVRRFGRTTRFSVFVSLGALTNALDTGWSEEHNATGELIRCLAPSLLPLSYAADRDSAAPTTLAMQAAIEGSGLLTAEEPELPAAAQRARRAGATLVRDARFSRRVIEAYEGLCSMCGLDVGLVQGAHIYPVRAPGSRDEPWNGLALCANHHAAFDKHVLAVDPLTTTIVFHDAIREQVAGRATARAFVEGTFDRLAEPVERSARPKREMFEKRYAFFAESYRWLTRR
jgi:hypothetical protein